MRSHRHIDDLDMHQIARMAHRTCTGQCERANHRQARQAPLPSKEPQKERRFASDNAPLDAYRACRTLLRVLALNVKDLRHAQLVTA
jgi:hypothetical protein